MKYLTDSPAAAVQKPVRPPSQRRALTEQEFRELDEVTLLARELRLNPRHTLTISGTADTPGHQTMARPGMLPPCC